MNDTELAKKKQWTLEICTEHSHFCDDEMQAIYKKISKLYIWNLCV